MALIGHPQQQLLPEGNKLVTYAYKEGARQFGGRTLEV
jgi:hypothetical protein